MRLAVRRLSNDARVPTRAHDGDAGFDLYALEAGTIAAGWPLAQLMGLLAAIVGLLSLFGSAQIAETQRSAP